MKNDTLKRILYMILGGLFGLVITSIFVNENDRLLTWDKVIAVILIVVIGVFIGTKARGLLDKTRSSD